MKSPTTTDTTLKDTASSPTGAKLRHHGIEHLVVVRESAIYNNELLAGMLNQTLTYCQSIPGAADVQRAGLDGLRSPKSRFESTTLRRGKTRADVIEHAGVVYLISAGSAHSVDDSKLQNSFIELFVEVVERYTPRCVHVANISRLVRSAEYGGQLLGTLKRHCETVYNGGVAIAPNEPHGAIMWQTLAMVAAMERDLIVQRLAVGKLNRFVEGRWPFSRNIFPPPWYVDDKGHFHLDETKVDAARKMLVLLADPALTPARIVELLAELGLGSKQMRRLHGPNATYADGATPTQVVHGLRHWAETYEEGLLRRDLPNPFPGQSRVAGVTVDYSSSPGGVIPLEFHLPMPEGGFSEEVIAAVIERRNAGPESLKGSRAHRRRRPLHRLPAQREGAFEYVLVSREKLYRLRRRASRGDA